MACVGQWMAWHGMCGSVEGMAWRERAHLVLHRIWSDLVGIHFKLALASRNLLLSSLLQHLDVLLCQVRVLGALIEFALLLDSSYEAKHIV